MAVATDNTVSAGVSIVKVPIVSTAPLNRNGTQTVNILEPASKPKDMATLKFQNKIRNYIQFFNYLMIVPFSY